MPRHTVRRVLSRAVGAVVAVATVTGLAGCGLAASGGYTPSGTLTGSVAEVDLSGLETSVTSKNFTEQLVLGKIAVILLRGAGAQVDDLTNAPGSNTTREAMRQGDIDMGWEYTGTAWISYLGHDDPIPDEQEQYAAVRDADLEENGLVWLLPAPMNNTYAFATTRQVGEQFGLTQLSDIIDVPPAERTFCVESEFQNRNDGFEPMLETYDLTLGEEVAPNDVQTLQTGAIYAALDRGDCNFGEIFTTDGRLEALDLNILEDDRGFFPKYNVSFVVREEVLEEHPGIEDLFAEVTSMLDDETLIALNARVDVDGDRPADVAFEWLQSEGFVE